MTAEALRQQLTHLADMQATLDTLKLDTSIRLKEAQKCTTAHDSVAMEAIGISPYSGCLLAS